MPSSFQYCQLCNFVQHHSKQTERKRNLGDVIWRELGRKRRKLRCCLRQGPCCGWRRRGGWGSSPGGRRLGRSRQHCGRAAAETQLTRLPPPLWPLAVTQRRKPPPPATKKTTTPLFLSFCPLQKCFQNRNDSWANEIFHANPIYRAMKIFTALHWKSRIGLLCVGS